MLCAASSTRVPTPWVSEVTVRPRRVVVLEPATIPKTPSGKLRRSNSVSLVT